MMRRTEVTPLVIGDVMYLSTGYNRVLALDASTGKQIWEYESAHHPSDARHHLLARRCIATPANRIRHVRRMADFAERQNGQSGTGLRHGGHGEHETRRGRQIPTSMYGMSSPPAIYKELAITGAHLPEGPSLGPSGDIRGWDMHNGKLVWTFHTIPRPGEPNHDAWSEDQWVDRSGANCWGFITVDPESGIAYIPIGTPTTDFYGADRKGSNLYGSSLLGIGCRHRSNSSGIFKPPITTIGTTTRNLHRP